VVEAVKQVAVMVVTQQSVEMQVQPTMVQVVVVAETISKVELEVRVG
jgi:hypothetical protein